MLAAYITCMVVGGAFIFISILFGGKDVDAEADLGADAAPSFDIDHDLDVDGDADLDADADVDVDLEAEAAIDASGGDFLAISQERTDGKLWLPFSSFKFWTFLMAGVGLTGTVLTLMNAGLWLTLGLALLVGLVAGTAIAWVLHRLKRQHVDSTVRLRDYIGQTGRVLIPPSPGEPGKILVELRGQKLRLLARSDEDFLFARGDEVFIYRCDDEGMAEVVHPARVLWRDGTRGAHHARAAAREEAPLEAAAQAQRRS